MKLDFRSVLEGLRASGRSKSLEIGKQFHLAAAQCGIDSDLIIATAVLDMYSKCGSLADARKVFEALPFQDLVTWNIIILAHAEQREGFAALKLFRCLQLEGLQPNGRTFAAVLAACSSISEDGKLFQGRSTKLTCLQQGMACHSLAAEAGLESDIFVGTALVDMYGRCGSLLDARASFDKMKLHDSVSWNALILSYVENGSSELALELFQCMQDDCGVPPSEITFAAALKACSILSENENGDLKLGSLSYAAALHKKLLDEGFGVSTLLGNALVELYGKCGSWLDAQRVFDGITQRDVVTWTAMLFAYAENGQERRAIDLFNSLQRERNSAGS